MAAVGIGGELDFVDGKEGDAAIKRHRFGGAKKIPGMRRDDFFFAGDEGYIAGAHEAHHPVVIFARQEPQRESDHPARMPKHPFDRKIGLAGIGGAKHGGEPGPRECRHARKIGFSDAGCKDR